MKTIWIAVMIGCCFACSADLWKVQTHATAKSAEYEAGLTNDWPRIETKVPDGYTLTAEDTSGGFELMTAEQYAARFSPNKESVASFYDSNPVIRHRSAYKLHADLVMDRLSNAELLALSTSTNGPIRRAFFSLMLNGFSPRAKGAGKIRNAITTLFGDTRATELLAKATKQEEIEYPLE